MIRGITLALLNTALALGTVAAVIFVVKVIQIVSVPVGVGG